MEPKKHASLLPSLNLTFLESTKVRIAIYVIFSFFLLLPIWMVKYPPLIDYPNHLARAFVLHHLNDPSYGFGHFYAPDWGPNPYFLADFLIQIFQRFVGIYTAGRLLLTLCILALPFSIAFFLRRANPGSEYLALWGFVIAYNPNFLMGFMSFELSIALCFIVVGVWLDYMRTGKEKYWLLALALATLLFLTHLGGFAIAGVALLLYTAIKQGIGKRFIRAGLVFVPGGLMFLYAKLHGWAGRRFDYQHWHFLMKLRHMFVPFKVYSRSVEALTLLAILATIIYFVRHHESLKLHLVWVPIVLAILIIHWVIPDTYGDLGFVDYRFCIFAFIFALAIPSFRGPRVLPIALACCVFFLHIFQVGSHFASEQPHLSRIASDFQYIPRGALVLAYTSRGDNVHWEKQDDLHFWGYGVIDRGWITPSLFHQSGVQPLQLRVPMYADDDQYGDGLQQHKYTIDMIEQTYDYLWTTNTDYLDPYLAKIGSPIFAQGELEIFKSKKAGSSPLKSSTGFQGD
jgi:hypothetical protein